MRLPVLILAALVGLTRTGLRAADEAKPAAADAAPALPLPAEVVKLTDVYRTELSRIAAQHAESLKALPPTYQAQLAALQKRLQSSGELDGYLGVTKEITRFAAAIQGEADPFEKNPEMPETALVTTPEALRAVQDQYLKDCKEKSDRRHKAIDDLSAAYIARLEALQIDLTKRGRINDAIAVKSEIDRLRKGVADGSLVQQALALMAAQPAKPATSAPRDETLASHASDASRWEYERDGNFAWEGNLFLHADLPDALTVDFDRHSGKGRIYGRSPVDHKTVDSRERSWFGKAVEWKVADASLLNATIVLQNREVATGQDSGPTAHLVLLDDNKGQVGEGLDIALMRRDVTLTVSHDAASGKCLLGWTEGKARKAISLPASGALHILLGVTVHNASEHCDTTIELR